jgi:signal transduction histidine kinase
MTLDESAFDPQAQAISAMRLSADRAKAKGIAIRVEAPPGLPLLRADARAFRRILINLLTNAVKFTHAGRIDLRIAVETGNRLSVAVEDTGIGMAEHEIPLARRPFGQVRNFLTRDIEGTGLGLPLSEQLARVHGATLTIESAKGRGTKVVVVFPPERTVPRPGVAS